MREAKFNFLGEKLEQQYNSSLSFEFHGAGRRSAMRHQSINNGRDGWRAYIAIFSHDECARW